MTKIVKYYFLCPRIAAKDRNVPVLPENTYCLIFLTFFRGDVSLVSSVIVRIQNHEAHCLRPVTPCVYCDPFAGFLATRDCGAATSTCCDQRTTKRPKIRSGDRILWSWLSRRWSGWRDALVFVQTGTVIAWQRKRFRYHWAKLSKHGRPGRPQVPEEIRALIRKMSEANIGWGSPRIVGELRKLRIDVAKSTVEKYRVRSRKPPSPTWKAFLNNHVSDLVAIDFFVVPTVRNKVLFLLVVRVHHRRRVVTLQCH